MKTLVAACICVGIAVFLTAVGIGLQLLPEGFDVEWNQVPLSEYDLGDLTGGIVLFGLAGAALAGIHLRRGEPGSRRGLARVLVVLGLVPLVAVATIVGLLVALCSGGGCG